MAGVDHGLATTAGDDSKCADLMDGPQEAPLGQGCMSMFRTTRIRGYGLVAMTFASHAKGREFDPHYPYCLIAPGRATHGGEGDVKDTPGASFFHGREAPT